MNEDSGVGESSEFFNWQRMRINLLSPALNNLLLTSAERSLDEFVDAEQAMQPGHIQCWSHHMKLEFLIPASPTPAFCSQIAFFRKCLDHLGGIYKDARVIAVFGDVAGAMLPDQWRPHLANVNVVWADPAEFAKVNFYAQGELRLEVFSPDADVVCLCDADTALLRSIPELLDDLLGTPAVLASVAHFTPFPERASHDAWQEVARTLLGKSIPLKFRHTLEDPADESRGRHMDCPFYVNQGVLFGTPDLFAKLRVRAKDLRQKFLMHYDKLFFSGQIALTLAIHDCAIPSTLR